MCPDINKVRLTTYFPTTWKPPALTGFPLKSPPSPPGSNSSPANNHQAERTVINGIPPLLVWGPGETQSWAWAVPRCRHKLSRQDTWWLFLPLNRKTGFLFVCLFVFYKSSISLYLLLLFFCLCWVFVSDVWASHCDGFSFWGARSPGRAAFISCNL